MTQQPNIVLIFVDNQPAKMLGCAGNDEVYTPNLDKLAAHGVRFSEAYCPNAMCSPCRASVLTGLMPSQHGIHTWLDDSLVETWPKNWNAIAEFDTLPEILAGNGYDTSLIGKYHLGIADQPQNGFDNWVTFQIGHVLSFYDCQMIDNGDRFTHPGHSVEFFTKRAVDYIGARKPDASPFFLFLTFPAPYGHWPSIKGEPHNRFAGRYRDTPFQSVPREGISNELIDWVLLRQEMIGDDDFYRDLLRMPNDLPTLRNYYSQMSMVDDGVGRVLAALDDSGQAGNTLVIYTSDHGMSLGEHGFWGHGEDTWPSNTFREANNIPLIVRPPDRPAAAKVVDKHVGTTNIFTTVLDYAGIAPDGAGPSPARSIRGLIEADDTDWDNAV
ncbi:MAG: sulfatase-like hydrolase/transferase, partial [Hyphomicrobiales bacterium]|nr:sulfatase-like hydrolase/transferase [Hyphomicrobiales bacterium]